MQVLLHILSLSLPKFEDSCKGAFAKLSETAGPKQYQNKNQIGKLRLF